MKKRTAMWGLAFLGLAVAGLIAFSLRHRDPPPPTPPTWEDLWPGTGVIYALASGTSPTGEAIVVAGGYVSTLDEEFDLRAVCYAEATGRVLWESRLSHTSAYASRIPHLEVDRSGDVLVGWSASEPEPAKTLVIEKLSGRDGRSLWKWHTSSWREHSSYVGIPKVDAQGRVWAAGIRQDSFDKSTRYLALLDPQTGAPIWQRDFNAALRSEDRRLGIAFLATGDAIVSVPPLDFYHGKTPSREPWLVQKVAASDGAIVWSVVLPRGSGDRVPDVECVLDEARQQVIAVSSSGLDVPDGVQSMALALGDGAQRWTRGHSPSQIQKGFAAFLHRNKAGEISGYTWREWESPKVIWGEWHKAGVFWLPRIEGHFHAQSKILRFSAEDGALLRQKSFGKREEFVSAVVRSPDGRVAACILRDARSGSAWRVVPEADAIAPWGQGTAKRVYDDWAAPGFPQVAIVTNSGRLAIAGSSRGADARVWQLRVW